MGRASGRWALAFFVACCGWPTLGWYVARMGDGSDEPWGVAALGLALVFAFRARAESGSRIQLAAGVLLGLGSCIGLLGTLPLVKALGLFLGVGILLADRRVWVGHLGLFALSLPVISSAQFFAGFPTRLLVGEIGAALLRLLGQPVAVEGVTLLWRGERIVIDAPCSGISMLWSSAFFACGLVCVLGIGWRRAILMLQCAALSAFAANVMRNVALFYVESGLWEVGAWAHDAVGLLAYGVNLALLGLVGLRLARASWRIEVCGERKRVGWLGLARWAGLAASLAVVLAAGRLTLAAGTTEAETDAQLSAAAVFDQVEGGFLEDGWAPMALDEATRRFARDFPGRIGLFARGGAVAVARVVDRPSRKLHEARACYRGWGFSVADRPMFEDAAGRLWGRFGAVRGGERWVVRERIEARDGSGWTDTSAWFWAATLGKGSGPWVAIAVAEREEEAEDGG